MSLLQPRESFSSIFASLISVIRDSSSVLFHLKLYKLSTNGTHQNADFQLLAWILTKFLMSFFKPQVSFPLNFASPSSVMTKNSSEIFLAELLRFGQQKPIKVQILRLLCALMKVHPIRHASFETTRSRFIQILHHFSVPWKISTQYFFSSNLYTLDKKQFSNFWVVGWKFTKFLMSCLKLQVSFSLKFPSLFNVMRDNSSVLF